MSALKDADLCIALEALEDVVLQHRGLQNNWCGMWYNCTECGLLYAKGGNWTVKNQEEVEGKCHICRADEALAKLEKYKGAGL